MLTNKAIPRSAALALVLAMLAGADTMPAAAAEHSAAHPDAAPLPTDLPALGSVDNQELAARLLTAAYGAFDQRQGCWIGVNKVKTDSGEWLEFRYCMKLDRIDALTADSGKRLYVLAAGQAITGAEPVGQWTPGLVGAFVLEDHGGHTEVIAAGDRIPSGLTGGSAPSQWKPVRLGPSDYWGWQNTEGYELQGDSHSRYVLLAPFGHGIRNLALQGIPQSRDDSGACPDDHCASTQWQAQLKVDESGGDSVYPLLLTVSGTDQGKDLQSRTLKLAFDRKRWSYTRPDDALFKDER